MSEFLRLMLVPAGILFGLAAVAEPAIVTREEWGARDARGDISTYAEYGLERPQYTRIVLHVTSRGYGEGAAEVRRIQDFHMDSRGFSDIGYNYLIDSAGAIFAGRSLDFVPAHAGRSLEGDERHDITLDPDYRSIGIVFSAETTDPLKDNQVSAAIALIGLLGRAHPIDAIITHTEIRGILESRGLTPQQDFDPHDCPGGGTIEQIVAIREAVDPNFNAVSYRRLFNSSW